jgi:hypothetical protein
MKNFFLVIVLLFILLSCKTTYIEVYVVERYPVEWVDTLITKPSHWHFCDRNNQWVCVESFVDTLTYTVKDTMDVKIHQGTFKEKEYKKLITQKENERKKLH